MTEDERIRLKLEFIRDHRHEVAGLMVELRVMRGLLEKFALLDQDPHVTDAEWSQFRRELNAQLERSREVPS